MPGVLDFLFVAYFAVVGPLYDYLVYWPAFRRRVQADPRRARRWMWATCVVFAWAGVAVGAAIWVWHGRDWASFGFTVPDGWRLWVSIALVLLLAAYAVYAVVAVAGSGEARAGVRGQFGSTVAILPRTRAELGLFGGLSLTAGFCEEFLFRGYFVWVFAPWLGWWGAAAVSAVLFGVLHIYQGWGGVIRTGATGVLLTLVVALTGSLWPAIVLHALVDVGSGIVAWLALREGPEAVTDPAAPATGDADSAREPQTG